MTPQPLRAPGPLLMLLEARAPVEFASLLAARPFLDRLPRGDGHPVLVLPGLGAGDGSTAPLRRFLARQGYSPAPWRQGRNLGPRPGVLDACSAELKRLADTSGRRVSLVGWSLGGLYARELAKERPDAVRCVITLGTPFAGPPRATNAWRFFRMVSRGHEPDPARLDQLRLAPPCPTTSVFSRSDGIVAWRASLNAPGAQVENVEIPASHLGMGVHPLAFAVVADRLAQDPANWKPFDVSGARRWFFRVLPH